MPQEIIMKTSIQLIHNIAEAILTLGHEPSTKELSLILRKYPKPEGGFFSKAEMIKMLESEDFEEMPEEKRLKVRQLLRMKPTRTISGVAPITIFTKPYACPGNCIFCPSQVDMPKSYLREEPGAMRAEKLKFDPYEQTLQRIQALENIGHNTDKVDIIISGGTWTYYPKSYREWYITEVFRALNTRSGTKSFSPLQRGSGPACGTEGVLESLHTQNESARHRCVGLTVETRPDYIDEDEIIHMRKMGVTKVQLGVQSLDENVLKLNQRGHTAEDSRKAINLLRLAGFKVHIHWMANLHGSTLEKDFADFQQLFKDPSVMPDELKIYPCSVVDNTKLKTLMDEGEFEPYKEKDLIDLLAKCKTKVPRYCRITRLFRDIPSQLIKGGTTKTNLRQLVQAEMKKRHWECNCIRCQEIRGEMFNTENITLNIFEYQTTVSKEYFISFLTKDEKQKTCGELGRTINYKLLGFLRLSLPKKELSENHFIEELQDAAMIREVHVYGRSIEIGEEGETQHLGLGKKLLEKAKEIATENSYSKMNVISAVGTRGYYRKRGFEDGRLYQYVML